MQTLPKPPKLSKDGGGPLSSKNGSIAAAGVTAAIAGLLIVVFLSQYRDNVKSDGVPTPVVVAEQLIEQGASGDSAGAQGLFKTTDVPRDQLKAGAVTDPSTLRGKVAAKEILPGQQLTDADFKPKGNGIVTKLGADQRAMSISFDSQHGVAGNVRPGDHVDVLAGFEVEGSGGANKAVLRTLMQDVLVLATPARPESGGVGGGGEKVDVTLRVATSAAPKLAFAADNGKLWLTLRPQNGAKLDQATLVTLSSLLVGSKPAKESR